jgi:hypothetical protein
VPVLRLRLLKLLTDWYVCTLKVVSEEMAWSAGHPTAGKLRSLEGGEDPAKMSKLGSDADDREESLC